MFNGMLEGSGGGGDDSGDDPGPIRQGDGELNPKEGGEEDDEAEDSGAEEFTVGGNFCSCLLYTSPSPRD